MPRKTRHQTTTRTGSGESQIQASAPSVQARVPYISHPYVNIRDGGAVADIRTAEALAGVGRVVNQIGLQQKKDEERRQFLEGRTQRSVDGDLTPDEFAAKMSEMEPGAYAKGYSAAHGRYTAYQMVGELQSELASRTDILTPQQAQSLISSNIKDRLQGLEGDEDYTAHFLDVVSTAQPKLMTQWRDRNYEESRDKLYTSYNTGLRGDIQTAVEHGVDPYNVMVEYRKSGFELGIPNAKLNEMMFDNIVEVAERTENPKLFDVFEKDTPSAEDPSKTIPGLANSPKWQLRIADARDKVERAIEAKKGASDDVKKYEYRSRIQDAILNEDFALAEQMAAQGVKDDLLTPDQGLSVRQKVVDERKELKLTREAGLKVESGRYFEADKKYVDKYLERKKDALDEWAGDDPAKQVQAEMALTASYMNSGRVRPAALELMKTATPAQGPRYDEAYMTYKSHYAIDPRLTESQIGDFESMQFNLYETMVKQLGIQPDAAKANLAEMMSRENRDTTKELIAERKHEIRAQLETDLLDGKGSEGLSRWFKGDALNDGYVKEKLVDLMSFYMGQGQGSYSMAMPWAVERFKSRHQLVGSPDGADGARWVYTGGVALPPNFEEAQTLMSNDLASNLKGTGNESEYYYLRRHPTMPEGWLVHKSSDNMFLVGKDGNPITMTTQDLMKSYYADTQPTMEERKADQASRQKRRVENPSVPPQQRDIGGAL